jgi:hypothetical protein
MSNAAATLPAFAVTAIEISQWTDGVVTIANRVTRLYRTKAAANNATKRADGKPWNNGKIVIEKVRTAPFESNGAEASHTEASDIIGRRLDSF